jgi:peptidyl-prolyl cis-trans isomerase B (cyclophilin B)
MKFRLLLPLLLISLSTMAAKKPQKVAFETDSGKIVIELYDGTPQHRDNMVKLVQKGFYDSLLWHRIIPGFVIQGGDPNSKHTAPGAPLGDGDVGYKVPAEINDSLYIHERGAVGMARDGNPEKASSGCQFYIVIGKTYTEEQLTSIEARVGHKFTAAQHKAYTTVGGVPHLDGGYTVFGKVVEGMDVAEKIAKAARDARDRPNVDIHIKKAYVIKKKKFLFF